MLHTPTNLSSKDINEAVDAYLHCAYEKPADELSERLDYRLSVEEILEDFECARSPGSSGKSPIRYLLRLGNERYPYMKLVIEESNEAGFFFFAVDTHDQESFGDNAVDEDLWREIQDYNLELKEKIEREFAREGLPTRRGVLEKTRKLRGAVAPSEDTPLVLIVDDEEDAAELLKLQLESQGITGVTSTWGEEALLLAEKLRPALIVVDYMMPGLSGGEFCSKLKLKSSCMQIPVVLASYAEIPERATAHADYVLQKPFDIQQLKKLITELTHSKVP